ncbi:phytoene dehydrogenase-like protein [Dyadobacter jejuensis]|uniref:Phytoene dehydrogenase-like protein n=1 Tax=Dyadobacter jejuensis TaxID=1082580 RepID=A0A316ALZ7_9BACT|nr:NAD(P)/FAD-dependent oxidoreductase [Dyadobacter jejuensis]PWJ58552.1 phytoene dehydrogenase-like protein [Dyadobacter jejuensis]
MEESLSKEYDFVIVGSGLGGLGCAYLLAKEGKSVIVLEKNHQIGGNLQVYSRDKSIFDTGVHYIGSMDPGENLYQFFKYFNILDELKLHRLDQEKFDVIRFADGSTYEYAQGHDRFQEKLIGYFPQEKEAITKYCEKIKEVCLHFPLYNLRADGANYQFNEELLQLNAHDYIAGLTENPRLRNVLAGSNLLYAGYRDTTPFYVHALIMNSYLCGAYKLIDGGSQIAILLSRRIREMGGVICKRKEAVGASYHSNGCIRAVKLKDGQEVRGKNFISNVHPSNTIDIFGEERFLKMYKNRIRNLENSISTFLVHIAFEKRSFPYLNYNIYQHHQDDVWQATEPQQDLWPESYFICTPMSRKDPEYADSMTVMTYMKTEETSRWQESFRTVAESGERGAGYQEFKIEKEERVLRHLETVFPGIRSKIKSIHSATPLTFRDYLGNKDGSLYGIRKSALNPSRTQINTRTKIPNLHLTGQNISMHGILGVTASAFVTCFSFINKEKLIDQVKQA